MLNAIKVIIGLGNPGHRYKNTRHNIGFLILDALAEKYQAQWHIKDNREIAYIQINGKSLLLIKPQTFMNSSGNVIPALIKDGIKPDNILVIHDELEKPLGKIEFKTGGSHRGHNGLRSIIEKCGADFHRLRFGIGRPEHKEDVPEYVLSNFEISAAEIALMIDKVVTMIESII